MNEENKFNAFKRIFEGENLPEEHKEQVMQQIDTLKFIMDVADIFTIKQVKANSQLCEALLNNEQEDHNSSEDVD